MPYMLLAFIYNPVQTSVFYITLPIYILCGYLLIWLMESRYYDTCIKYHLHEKILKANCTCKIKIFQKFSLENHPKIRSLCYFLLKGYVVCGIIYVVVFFSIIFIYILTLGSFSDFEGAQSLVLPLVIAILTYFVVNPIYKYLKEGYDSDNSSNTPKNAYNYGSIQMPTSVNT